MVATSQDYFVDKSGLVMLRTPKDRARAERLKRLRLVMGYRSQRQFSFFLGVDYARYNNAERGLPLSRQLAEIIVSRCPGVTGDWLNYGDEGGLSFRVVKALGALPLADSGKGITSAD